MSHKTRLWCHDALWRVQDHCQLTNSHGTIQDAWESWRDEHGHVMLFETEEQARTYRDGSTEKATDEGAVNGE